MRPLLDRTELTALCLMALPLVCSILLVSACSKKQPIEKLEAKYSTVQGTLSSPPVVANDRLVIFLQQSVGEEILVCIAVNDDNERLLQGIAATITENTDPDAPLMIYGQEINGQWNEYIEGVDIQIQAIGYYYLPAKKYQIVITTYGDRATDAFRGISWGQFLQKVGKKAVDAAL